MPEVVRTLSTEGAGAASCVAHGTCNASKLPLTRSGNVTLVNLLLARLRTSAQDYGLDPDALYMERVGTITFAP